MVSLRSKEERRKFDLAIYDALFKNPRYDERKILNRVTIKFKHGNVEYEIQKFRKRRGRKQTRGIEVTFNTHESQNKLENDVEDLILSGELYRHQFYNNYLKNLSGHPLYKGHLGGKILTPKLIFGIFAKPLKKRNNLDPSRKRSASNTLVCRIKQEYLTPSQAVLFEPYIIVPIHFLAHEYLAKEIIGSR